MLLACGLSRPLAQSAAAPVPLVSSSAARAVSDDAFPSRWQFRPQYSVSSTTPNNGCSRHNKEVITVTKAKLQFQIAVYNTPKIHTPLHISRNVTVSHNFQEISTEFKPKYYSDMLAGHVPNAPFNNNYNKSTLISVIRKLLAIDSDLMALLAQIGDIVPVISMLLLMRKLKTLHIGNKQNETVTVNYFNNKSSV